MNADTDDADDIPPFTESASEIEAEADIQPYPFDETDDGEKVVCELIAYIEDENCQVMLVDSKANYCEAIVAINDEDEPTFDDSEKTVSSVAAIVVSMLRMRRRATTPRRM